ncbi:hypothetical protein HHL11_25215 [Ramlibacter sp. G-1-2-2]|uniref:Uncharacterized protein n=1 Tax=Ramlibacter agri TaxID=2728837 RepID=A0A848HC76_9BURK|nr:hypothetical protein [Ramlibacter agri]NML47070.1 hypothetical protein [Ramlibacter agri]
MERYPRNAWYVAALHDEVRAGELLVHDAGAVRCRRKLEALLCAEEN